MEPTNAENSNVVEIDLSDSTYAHNFNSENRIHRDAFKKAIDLIEVQIKKDIDNNKDSCGYINHLHNTISVFGERGTGKTSFVYSIFDELKKKHKEIEILGIIDPTIIEEKAHIFLLLVSIINEKVKNVLEEGESKPGSDCYNKRLKWDKCLKELAKGLPSLDNVGKDYNNNNWQDDEFIMKKGLDDIISSYHLEENFHKLVEQALLLLDKKVFLVAFDDIDINMDKGWRVLETIRKYITTPKIITILSGNLNLYNLNVRGQQWNQFGQRLLTQEENRNFEPLVSQLENQYMLKVFKAENRIHLYSISYSIRLYNMLYMVKESINSEPRKLDEVYEELFKTYGICSKASLAIYRKYMMSLSIRSQINYLKVNLEEKDKISGISCIEAFLSRMYAANIDVNLTFANPDLLNIIILTYLTNEKNIKEFRDTYLLMPSIDDEEKNACLTGLSIMFSTFIKNNPNLIFDYMIRVGFLRNLLLSCNDTSNKPKILDFGGFLHNVSLKNIIGTSMAYKSVDKQKGESMKLFKKLYGLDSKAKGKNISKEDIIDRIDSVLKDKAAAIKILGYIPICAFRYENKNDTQLFYSFFFLLASIGNILREINNNSVSIKSLLKDMAQLRSYTVPETKKTDSDSMEDFNFDDELSIDDDVSLTKLSESIKEWISGYGGVEVIPTYVIGRIMTRFHHNIIKIEADNLGDYMNIAAVAFINACLIEEIKEYDEETIAKINLNSVIKGDKIFSDNLSSMNDKCKFTIWIASCPLIMSFLHNTIINYFVNSNWIKSDNKGLGFNMYSILEQVKLKEAKDDRLKFSYADDKYLNIYNYLKEKGFNMDNLKKVNTLTLEGLKTYFSENLSEKSLRQFINKIKRDKLSPFDLYTY